MEDQYDTVTVFSFDECPNKEGLNRSLYPKIHLIVLISQGNKKDVDSQFEIDLNYFEIVCI